MSAGQIDQWGCLMLKAAANRKVLGKGNACRAGPHCLSCTTLRSWPRGPFCGFLALLLASERGFFSGPISEVNG